MYSPDEKRKAIELFIKYDHSATAVVNELGYPSRGLLYIWHRQYQELGEKAFANRMSRYNDEEKRIAVEHYFEHGRCLARTMRMLGYPKSSELLSNWVRELEPGRSKPKRAARTFTYEQRKSAVIDLESRRSSADEVAKKHGASRELVYSWRRDLLGKGGSGMDRGKPLPSDASELQAQIAQLKEQVRRLELEKDILEGTVEILKKGQGADPASLTNKEKADLIGALRPRYMLKDLLNALQMPRSSYQYALIAKARPDKYAEIRAAIADIFIASRRCYGYRRIWLALKNGGTTVSEKVVSRIMREGGFVAKRAKRRTYSSYSGEVSQAPSNLVKRRFHAAAPNRLWLTDITEFRIPAGKAYLSPVIDCYDGMVVAYSTSTSPSAELANSMLMSAVSTLKPGERPVIHSDRGGHYRWPEWVRICEDSGLVRSMSKKGCSPDNSACEGFFGRMKVEMFYGERWAGWTTSDFMDEIDEYIRWYNGSRIKKSLGGKSPIEYREEGVNAA